MHFDDYLAHIHINQVQAASLDLLHTLQRQHIHHIPWENLDIFFKKTIVLDVDTILKKFISERRGGICFELNGAYHALLTALGFKTTLVQAKIFGFHDKQYQTPRDTHIVNLVELAEGHYLTDVAWDGLPHPLPLSGEIVTDITGSHRVTVGENNTYILEKEIGGTWHRQYQFGKKPVSLNEMSCHVDYSNASPEREAAHQLLYTRHQKDGFIALVNDRVFFQGPIQKKSYFVSELGGLPTVLTTLFKVKVEAVAQLLSGSPLTSFLRSL